MANIIIHPNDDGGMTFVMIAPNTPLSLEQCAAQAVPAGVPWRVVDHTILTDHDFRDAWQYTETGDVIPVNFAKAQAITKNRLRSERDPLLTAQDVLFQRALETGADTTSIIAEKQRLRDITNLTDSCTTLNELRALHC